MDVESESREIVQLSELPLFTCAVVIVAEPTPLSVALTFWQIAVGGRLSTTVMVDAHEDVFA